MLQSRDERTAKKRKERKRESFRIEEQWSDRNEGEAARQLRPSEISESAAARRGT
jgi:hypothetical protein